MSDTIITVIALGLAAALCFRIAWEEWKWPSKPRRPNEATQPTPPTGDRADV